MPIYAWPQDFHQAVREDPKDNKWNGATKALLGKLKETRMETLSQDTMRYLNAAYLKRTYGK